MKSRGSVGARQFLFATILSMVAMSTQAVMLCDSSACAVPPSVPTPNDPNDPLVPLDSLIASELPFWLIMPTLVYSGADSFSLISNYSIILDYATLDAVMSKGGSISLTASTLTLVGNQESLPEFLNSVAITNKPRQLDDTENSLSWVNANPVLLQAENIFALTLTSAKDIYVVDKSRLFVVPSAVPIPGALGLLLSGILGLSGLRLAGFKLTA